MRKIVKERAFYSMLFAITIPIALKELINFGVSMTDTFMLGQISDIQISACSQANQPQFIFTLFNFGLAGGACVLAAQYWGKKDVEAIRKIIGMVLKISIIISLLLTLTVQLFPEQIMGIYIDISEAKGQLILSEAVDYLRIVSLGYFFFGLSMTFQNSIRSVEIVKISTLTSLISFFINVFLNWVFIFGNLGAEAMGIRGAALATLIARIVDFIITAVFALIVDKRLQFKLKYIFKWDKQLSSDLMKISLPVVANELMWALGISCQSAILGQLSTEIISANAIASVLQQLSTIVIMGVANAAAIVVGKKIGENDLEGAKNSAWTISLLSVLLGLISSAVVFLLRKPFVMLYNIDEASRILTQDLLIITSVFVFFVSISAISIVGVLRGAGDTKFTLKLEAVCLWCIALPVGMITGFIFHAPILAVYAALKIDEPLKSVFAFRRILKDSTYRNVTR